MTAVEVRRIWIGQRRRRHVVVETRHPTYGWLKRGEIRCVDVADTLGPGLAGHLVWQLTDYDWRDLGQITGDYRTAEQALLDATRILEH